MFLESKHCLRNESLQFFFSGSFGLKYRVVFVIEIVSVVFRVLVVKLLNDTVVVVDSEAIVITLEEVGKMSVSRLLYLIYNLFHFSLDLRLINKVDERLNENRQSEGYSDNQPSENSKSLDWHHC